MRRRRLCYIVLLAISLCLTGCLPAAWTVVPEVRGRVVTPAGEAAAGATVRITSADSASHQPAIQITTDQDGRFRRNEETRWAMVAFLPLDAIAPRFIATASQASLESAPRSFGGGITNPHHFGLTNKGPSFDLGNLVLGEPASEQ